MLTPSKGRKPTRQRGGVSLMNSLLQPVECLSIVLLHAFTVNIHPQRRLCARGPFSFEPPRTMKS
jgi:hypothetical protein